MFDVTNWLQPDSGYIAMYVSYCNVWDAHMGSVIPMTATALPFYYMYTGPARAASS